MKNGIVEIVITGGPCSGKTTALPRIEQVLKERGCLPLVCPEVASSLILSGYHPGMMEMMEFQSILTPMQLSQLKHYRDAAARLRRLYPQKTVVIIYDRGILDGKAYITQPQWEALAQAEGFDESEISQSYDAVFHLKTAADGARFAYTLNNNGARSENNPDYAVQIDAQTSDCWVCHPNFKIIECTQDFEQKLSRLLSEIINIVG